MKSTPSAWIDKWLTVIINSCKNSIAAICWFIERDTELVSGMIKCVCFNISNKNRIDSKTVKFKFYDRNRI